MKTNKEAQEQIYKKANAYFCRKKQQKRKILLNSLIVFFILPAVVLSFSMNLFNIQNINPPIIDNSMEDSGVVSDNTQTSNLESSTIPQPQRKIIYADDLDFWKSKEEHFDSSLYYDEELFNKYIGQDVEFFVLIQFRDLDKETNEIFKNKPLKSAQLYPDITWNEFEEVYKNFSYHCEYDKYTGEYTYDSFGNKITYDYTFDLSGNKIYKDANAQAEIDRMLKYYNNLQQELRVLIKDYQYKCLRELNIKFADELNATNEFKHPFAFITFDDIEKLKNLPFSMMLICVPEDIEQLKNIEALN